MHQHLETCIISTARLAGYVSRYWIEWCKKWYIGRNSGIRTPCLLIHEPELRSQWYWNRRRMRWCSQIYMKTDSINGVLGILISTVKSVFGGNLKSCLRKIRLRRVASIVGENSINFELGFQILSDDRGPGPLSSDEIWEFNSKFIEFFPAIEGSWWRRIFLETRFVIPPKPRLTVDIKIHRTPLMESTFTYVCEHHLIRLRFQYHC